MQISKMNMGQLRAALANANERHTQLLKDGFLEEGTLVVSLVQEIGRITAEIAQRQPALQAA